MKKLIFAIASFLVVFQQVDALVSHGSRISESEGSDDAAPLKSAQKNKTKNETKSAALKAWEKNATKIDYRPSKTKIIKRLVKLTVPHVGSGTFRCTSSNRGAGFILYTTIPVNERWNKDKLQADFRIHRSPNLVCIRWNKGSWQYDSHWEDEPDRASKTSWHDFKLRSDDIAVATVDFAEDAVETLENKRLRYHGLHMGYKSGTLKITATCSDLGDSKCEGRKGEKNDFIISGGSFYPWPDDYAYVPLKPKAQLPPLPVNMFRVVTGTFRCSDEFTGRAFLMYTEQFVNDRWNLDKTQDDFRLHSAKNFVCVRYFKKKWEYDSNWASEPERQSNVSWHEFTPLVTDIVVAAFQYENEKITSFKGINLKHGKMQFGYRNGDLLYYMNQNSTLDRARGNFRMTGSWIWTYDKGTLAGHQTKPHPGIVTTKKPFHKELVHKFTCTRNSTGKHVFIMFSPRPLAARLNPTTKNLTKGGPSPAEYQKAMKKGFMCVQYIDHNWFYDAYWTSNHSLHPFVPNTTDVVIAYMNYASGKIALTNGTNTNYAGMKMGYAGGDMSITAAKGPGKWETTFTVKGKHLLTYSNESAAVSPFTTTTTTTTTTATTTKAVKVAFFTTTTTTTLLVTTTHFLEMDNDVDDISEYISFLQRPLQKQM